LPFELIDHVSILTVTVLHKNGEHVHMYYHA
jgi:hypothetical protein